MILNIQQQVQAQVADAIRKQFGLADIPPFAVEVPPTRALGDLAVTARSPIARFGGTSTANGGISARPNCARIAAAT